MQEHKYDIIYLDPPWAYNEKVHLKGKVHSSADHHYMTMTPKALKAMRITRIAAADCLLVMWVTGPQLDVAVDLVYEWGFQYEDVLFCWDKGRINPGSYTLTQFEYVIVAKRIIGGIPQPRGSYNIPQMIRKKRGKHSQKPEIVACYIDQMFPASTKIELFARRRREGWVCWGNELQLEPHYQQIRQLLFG